ncbi:hypothetical protein [Rossellomorea marisflavi]|uniref:hypothetical protein n=1 Tax=Rossellomorea marisflavi TaxID=189381 RepID=UPI003FA01680
MKWFKKKKENKLEQAKRWHEALLALGEKPDLETLERIALERKIEESEFPYEALFTFEEFVKIIDYHYPEEEGDGSDYHFWVTGAFRFNTIESAVYAKQLVAYLHKIEASLDMIGTKETIVSASASVKEKWDKLCHEAEETRHELLRVSKCEDRPDSDWGYHLTFSKTALLPEEELMGLVDENLKGGKPVVQKLIYSKDGAYPVTSPALMDLNQFLNENELPDDVYTELQKTINEIETRLKEEREADKEINIRLEAEIRTKTAKDYHQIS